MTFLIGYERVIASNEKYKDVWMHLPENPIDKKKGSLADLAQRYYGKPLSKDITMVNWEVRPMKQIWVLFFT